MREDPSKSGGGDRRGRLWTLLAAIVGGGSGSDPNAARGGTTTRGGETTRRDETAHGDETATRRDDSGTSNRIELPEETLYNLVLSAGGRTRQSALIEETSWSPSRVSRRLQNLEAAGWIRRVRQGRENVVFVPTVR